MDRRMRSTQEHFDMLVLQLQNLRDCCELFDAGRQGQALLMASILRNLFHSTRTTVSIVRHLRIEHDVELFSIAGAGISVAEEMTQRASGSYTITMGLNMGGLVPSPSLNVRSDLAPLQSWWREELVYSDGAEALTRERVVLLLAEKDGGAHVDNAIPPGLQAMREGNSTYTATLPDGAQQTTKLDNQHWALVRQFSEEVLHCVSVYRVQKTLQDRESLGS